jgi:hypothetical protein
VYTYQTASNTTYAATSKYISQCFTTSRFATTIISCIVSAGTNGNFSGSTVTLSIFLADANDKPTGSALGTGTFTVANNSANSNKTVTFSSPISVTPNTKYCVWINGNVNSLGLAYQNTNAYPLGKFFFSNDNISWTEITTSDLYFQINEGGFTSGTLTKASARITELSNVIGFAINTVSSGSTVSFTPSGFININKTGLTAASVYYLSDTDGAISSSAGTISKTVGYALSSTNLLVKLA